MRRCRLLFYVISYGYSHHVAVSCISLAATFCCIDKQFAKNNCICMEIVYNTIVNDHGRELYVYNQQHHARIRLGHGRIFSLNGKRPE